MLKPLRSILFATDLSKNCQPALDFTIAMATRFNATIYMLHVIESLPEGTDERLRDLLGRHQWQELVQSTHTQVRKSLLGKQSTNARVREEVQKFCKNTGIDQEDCDFKSSEIIISDGELVEEILHHAKANKCELIVMGAHKSMLSGNAIGSTIKAVLKKSTIGVTVVPAA